jgi:hypothetical protein
MGNDKPRRHHQVPQFYLRGFADADDRVKVIRFGDPPTTYVTNVKNVAVESNFYTVDWLDPAREDLAEQLISGAEKAAAGALHLLLQGHEPTLEQRGEIATWVALQYGRGRGKRVDSIGMQKTMLRANLALGGKQRLASRLSLDDPAEIDELWDRVVVRGDVADPPSARYQHIRTMIKTVELVAPVYAQARWQIVTFKHRRLFTSDQPICLWSPPSDDPGIGMLTADAVSVPLARDTGLMIFPQIQTGEIGESVPTTQYYRWFVVQSWTNAEELLILHPDDDLPNWLPARLQARLGTLDLPDVQQFIDIGEAWPARREQQERSDHDADASFASTPHATSSM